MYALYQTKSQVLMQVPIMLRNSQEYRFFLLLLALVTVAFIFVLQPFYGAIFWAVVLAILFMPLQRYLLSKMPRWRNAAALLTTLCCLLIAVLPVIITIGMLVQEGTELYQRIQSGELDIGANIAKIWSMIPAGIQVRLDSLGLGDWGAIQQRLSSVAMEGSKLFAAKAFSIGQNTFSFVVAFFIMLYMLFFFLRDGKQIQRQLGRAIPLGESNARRLGSKFIRVVRATVKGNLLIALIQGTLGGIILAILGIPSPYLLGVVMVLLSLLPAVGAGLVWLPVALYLLAIGSVIKAVILIAFGVLVIGLVDNLLRPILVGKDTQMPDYLVLVSTLGGLALFGLNGFVIGPLIAALFLAAWSIFSAPPRRKVLLSEAAPKVENSGKSDH